MVAVIGSVPERARVSLWLNDRRSCQLPLFFSTKDHLQYRYLIKG